VTETAPQISSALKLCCCYTNKEKKLNKKLELGFRPKKDLCLESFAERPLCRELGKRRAVFQRCAADE
jgi:hypothetical protein